MDTQTFDIGEIVIRRGEESDHAYRILEGSAHVYLEKDNKIVTLTTLEKGAVFGEMSLLTNDKTNANIQAGEKGLTVELITKEALQSRLDEADPLIQTILQSMIYRLDEVNKALLESETREFVEIDLI